MQPGQRMNITRPCLTATNDNGPGPGPNTRARDQSPGPRARDQGPETGTRDQSPGREPRDQRQALKLACRKEAEGEWDFDGDFSGREMDRACRTRLYLNEGMRT